MQISLSLGLLGLMAAEGQELSALRQGLDRLCPTGVNVAGLSENHAASLERVRRGEEVSPEESAIALAALVGCLQTQGFLQPAFAHAPGIRLFQENAVPLERLSFPAFGGVDLSIDGGTIRFAGRMWSNKDILIARSQGKPIPKYHVLEANTPHIGSLSAEFLRNNFFVTRTPPVFIVEDEIQARILSEFLRQTYESTEPEAVGAFPSPSHDSLRRILCFDENKRVTLEEGVCLERLRPHVYRITDGGRMLGLLNLEHYARLETPSPIRPRADHRKARLVRRQALEEGRAGLWPIGTANGFATREETSGFMIWNKSRYVLIDPPSSTVEYLKAHDLPVDRLDGIVITHGHTDHCTDAVPRLLELRPKARIYTTKRIFDDLVRQLDLALGKSSKAVDFNYRRFVEILPRTRMRIGGLAYRFHETLHSLPALGFEIWNKRDLVVHFSGDTFADPAIFEQFQTGKAPFMTRERAFEVLRHYFLIPERASQRVPPFFLIEAGVPPLHTSPELTRAYLDYLKKHLGIDTSRVLAYHISDEKAADAKLRKWAAGHEGWIDLSPYYP